MANEANQKPESERKVGIGLGIGIFFLPVVFSWFTLRNGHTKFARIASFAWLGVGLFVMVMPKPSNTSTARSAAASSSSSSAAAAPAAPAVVLLHDQNSSCRALGDTFSTTSDKTELQLDGMFESMKGRLFQYNVRVKAVEVTFGSLSLQVACPQKKSILDTSDFVLSAGDEFKPQLAQLGKDASITVCGQFTSYTRFTGLHGDLVALGACPNATLGPKAKP